MIWRNVDNHPDDPKYRNLRYNVVKNKVGSVQGGLDTLEAMGFMLNAAGSNLVLDMKKDLTIGRQLFDEIAEWQKKFPSSLNPSVRAWGANKISGGIFIGDKADSADRKGLEDNKITRILNVADNVKNTFESDSKFNYKRLEVQDFGKDQGISRVFYEAAEWLKDAAEKQENVLVHCYAGMNRSVTVVIASLMINEKMTLKEAWETVKAQRTMACPFADNREELIRFEKQLTGKNTMTAQDFNPAEKPKVNNYVITNEGGGDDDSDKAPSSGVGADTG